MANHPAVDPVASATETLMAAIQGYVRAAVTSEATNGQAQPGTTQVQALQARFDAIAQENRELKDKIKKFESKKSTRALKQQERQRDSIRAALSAYAGVDVPESKLNRHLASKAQFRPFKKLPFELRMKIWKFALPGGRIFELANGDGHFHRVLRSAQPAAANQPNPIMMVRFASGLPEMSITAHKTPKLRLACKEANRAFLEAGSFEFGLFGGPYRGIWFNHAEDILYIRDEPSIWTNVDMSRILRVALPHTKFLNKDNCTAKIDIIINHFTACREVIMLQTLDWEMRSCLPHPRMPAKFFPLRGDDVIGQHDYPMELSTEIGNVALWRDVKRVVEHLWREHVVDVRMLSENRIPKLVGMEMLRARPSYFD